MIRDLLKQFLEVDGHVVSTAKDGADGLAIAKALRMDLIVLDGDLPNSVAIRTQFKSEASTSHLAVLCVGTRSSRDRFEQMAKTDSDSYLAMPFTFVQIRQSVVRLLRLSA